MPTEIPRPLFCALMRFRHRCWVPSMKSQPPPFLTFLGIPISTVCNTNYSVTLKMNRLSEASLRYSFIHINNDFCYSHLTVTVSTYRFLILTCSLLFRVSVLIHRIIPSISSISLGCTQSIVFCPVSQLYYTTPGNMVADAYRLVTLSRRY